MTITHHPDISSLMCCSAGSQPEAFACVIASHLAMCPKCCAEVRKMQKIGVALFDTLEPQPMATPPPVIAMRAGEAEHETSKSKCVLSAGEIPQLLVTCVGPCLDQMAWHWVAPGIWTHCVRLSEGACGDLRLFKIAPGTALPEHGHVGQEMTLVLRGSYSDEHGKYCVGDVSDLDEGTEHTPIACPEKGCICLMASEHKPQFKGWLARLLQPIFGT